MDCIFCKIINGDIPCYKVYEDEKVLAFLDVNPKALGHTLIVPKTHYTDLSDIPEDVLSHILKIAKTLKEKMFEKLECDGVTLVQNNGVVQEVKHFHLHVIPTYTNNKKELSFEETTAILK